MTGDVRTKVQRGKRADDAYGPRLLRRLELARTGVSLLVAEDEPQADDGFRIAASIRAGLSAKFWLELRRLGLTSPELAAVIGVSEKTISRKQHGREPLDVVEGDRTLRITHLVLEAAHAFGDLGKALRWLRKPNRALGGESPLDLAVTEPGTALVRRALGVVEYGGVA